MRAIANRLLILAPGLNGGGAERQLLLVATGLVNRGWDVHILTMASGGQYWAELAESKRIKLHSLDRRGRWDFSIISESARYVRRHQIGIVQGWMQPCNTFAALCGRITRRNVVLGVRTVSRAVYGVGPRTYLRSEPMLARWARATVICNSRAGLMEWLDLGVQAERLHHIPNGLLLPQRLLAPPFASSGPLRIGMLARLDPVKGHDMVLRALGILKDQGLDFRFSNWGEGEPAAIERLRSRAGELGIADRAEFRSACESPWDALESMDVFVSASLAEGMSNAIMEAMGAGRVVVATDVGDTSLLLGPAESPSGVLFAPSDKALADAIAAVASDRNRAVALAVRAKQKAAREFSIAAMVDAYESVYAGLASTASRG
ncbi:MAG: glycosyltransferase [Betaproteobacteria bacterium]|nr:MAG: glycosyltransferase [Betaproteobacteria bacterium]